MLSCLPSDVLPATHLDHDGNTGRHWAGWRRAGVCLDVNQGRLERHRCRYDVWVSSLAGSLRLSSGGMCVQVRQTP
jgi:hypothetical protein